MRRIVVSCSIVGLVILAIVIVRSLPTSIPEEQPITEVESFLPAFRFRDITDEAGIQFSHTSSATPQKLLPETMGSGLAVIDFDRDGLPDLFFVNSRPWPGQPTPATGEPTQKLYRNRGDGRFEDVSEQCGLGIELYGLGVAVGDYDNDGWPDIFITAVGGNRLFHNSAGTRFEEVTLVAGFPKPTDWKANSFDAFLTRNEPLSFPSSATFLDYDGDGLLDLFVCNYLTWSPASDFGTKAVLPGGLRAYVPPQQFNGAQCSLYRNLGKGKFEDISEAAGVHVSELRSGSIEKQAMGKSLGVVVCDADDDGWPDIVVANDTVRNFFFHNVPSPTGGRRLQEDGLFSGLAYADGRPRGGMGIDSAEVLPSDLAIVIANFSSEPNSLFRRLTANPVRFADTAPDVGLASASLFPMKFGIMFFDSDLDGRPDLFVANGHLEPDIARAQTGQLYAQRGQLFWNTGNARSLLIPADAELFPPMVGRGCAYLDFDADGDLDVVITSNNGRARLFRNDTKSTNRFVRLVFEGTKKANRDAFGARIETEIAGVTRHHFLTPTRGYLSQSEASLTIGLGASQTIDRIAVRWPGDVQPTQTWVGLEAGQTYRLKQGQPDALPIKPVR